MKPIAIIGLGYVGLPLAIQFARSGVKVIGIDIDPHKPERINRGESYFKHVAADGIREVVDAGMLEATTEFSRCREVEAIILCLPTPLNSRREPELKFVLNTAETIAPYLPKGCLVVLESTTYPGTTEGELRQVLEAGSGMSAGVDFHLGFSPEREDPGNPASRVADIPKLVSGLTPACLQRTEELYSHAVKTLVPVSSCRVAEASKLLENIFRSVNIALVNELKLVYGAMDIDIWEVIKAASTKPFGYMPFYPGPGLGGHCIPIDPFYLTWKAKEFGMKTLFIELAGEINTSMPDHAVSVGLKALNETGHAVKGARVLILGLAYKPDIDDDRESPSYRLIQKFEALGAEVSYHDSYIPVIPRTRSHAAYEGMESVPAITDDYELIVIATGHRDYHSFDFSGFQAAMVDTRNTVAPAHRPRHYHRA